MNKVIVAMSGGVDSSVAAALLKREGFDVIGVFMKFWSGETEKNRCCTPESEKRARLVAEKLGIPFYVFNFEKEFKKKVVDYFLKEYKAGLTPNPCVVCNKEIKFKLLFKKMLSLNADYIATGHYARLRQEIRGAKLLKNVLKIKNSHLVGHPKNKLPNIISFWFDFIEGESIVIQLDLLGIATSTGSACSSLKLEPSPVLLAIGLKPQQAHGSLRISLGRWTTEKEVDYLIKVLPDIVKKLRKISPYGK